MAEVVLIIDEPMARGDIPAWCERVRELVALTGVDTPIVCDVAPLAAVQADVDAAVVDGLAQMQLTARRLGTEIRLRGASKKLCGLLALFGLAEVIPLCLELAVEGRREPEEWEESGGVEEEVQPDDPSV